MTRLAAIVCALLIVLSGCGGGPAATPTAEETAPTGTEVVEAMQTAQTGAGTGTATDTSTATDSPTVTPSPTSSPTPTPTATATPTASPSPTPTPTPTPELGGRIVVDSHWYFDTQNGTDYEVLDGSITNNHGYAVTFDVRYLADSNCDDDNETDMVGFVVDGVQLGAGETWTPEEPVRKEMDDIDCGAGWAMELVVRNVERAG